MYYLTTILIINILIFFTYKTILILINYIITIIENDNTSLIRNYFIYIYVDNYESNNILINKNK